MCSLKKRKAIIPFSLYTSECIIHLALIIPLKYPIYDSPYSILQRFSLLLKTLQQNQKKKKNKQNKKVMTSEFWEQNLFEFGYILAN